MRNEKDIPLSEVKRILGMTEEEFCASLDPERRLEYEWRRSETLAWKLHELSEAWDGLMKAILKDMRSLWARKFIPGERVNYRPLEEIERALEDGYLELEYLSEGSTVHETIQRGVQVERGKGNYYCWIMNEVPGRLPETSSKEYVDAHSLGELVENAHLDLHAFRWYPRLDGGGR